MDIHQQIAAKLGRIKAVMDVESAIRADKDYNSPAEIAAYYSINRLAYRRFQSKEGFMHFRISKDGAYSEDDIYYQPDTVSSLIPRHGRVLELGFGQGANLFYLAERRPDAFFCGADLCPLNPPRKMPNLRLFKQNYSSLSNFPDNAFDVVYAVETLIHNSDKDKDTIFREVYRVLKPGGVFVVYEYAIKKEYGEYDEAERTAIAMIAKCGAAAMIETSAQWEGHFTAAGFRPRSVTNLSKEVEPDLRRLERKANRIFSRPRLAWLMFHTLPRYFVNNIALGWLGYDACRAELGYYMEWIYEKPTEDAPVQV